ncbi:MAG: hypothetical protein ABL953_04510 [Ilumatobacteraceae bacterium]
MNITAIRAQLASQFVGFHAYATEPTQADSPYVTVGFPEVGYDTTFGGVAELTFVLEIGTATSDETTAEKFLASTLDGLVSTVVQANALWRAIAVKRSSKPQAKVIGNATFNTVQAVIEVHA